jgi:hypothetical protein
MWPLLPAVVFGLSDITFTYIARSRKKTSRKSGKHNKVENEKTKQNKTAHNYTANKKKQNDGC